MNTENRTKERIKNALTVVVLGALAVSLFVAGSFHGSQNTAGATEEQLQQEFDRGMKAGVEYQEWFCEQSSQS